MNQAVHGIEVCELAEVEDGAARGFELPGYHLDGFLVRRGDRVYAYVNVCPHAANPLNWKPDAFLTKNRELIMCSVHGAIFEIEDGRCIGGPCVGKYLQALDAEVVDGRIVVRYPA